MRLSRRENGPHAKNPNAGGGTTDFAECVYAAVLRIPKGRVSTYQGVAYAIGKPLAARAVGNALNRNPYRHVPCHRVVPARGTIGGYAWGTPVKAARLRGEGVRVENGTVALMRYYVSLSKI